jgi:hypothetical protein
MRGRGKEVDDNDCAVDGGRRENNIGKIMMQNRITEVEV